MTEIRLKPQYYGNCMWSLRHKVTDLQHHPLEFRKILIIECSFGAFWIKIFDEIILIFDYLHSLKHFRPILIPNDPLKNQSQFPTLNAFTWLTITKPLWPFYPQLQSNCIVSKNMQKIYFYLNFMCACKWIWSSCFCIRSSFAHSKLHFTLALHTLRIRNGKHMQIIANTAT